MDFTWMKPDKRQPTVTIDNQRRIYLSAEARKLLGVKPPFHLLVGYDKANKRIVLGWPEAGARVQPFKFDMRSYAHARRFVRDLAIPAVDLPQNYDYMEPQPEGMADGMFVFERTER